MNGKYIDNIDNFIGQAVYTDVNHSGFTSLQAAADAAIDTYGDNAVLILAPGEYNSDITVSSPLVIKELVPGTVIMSGTLSGAKLQTLNITGNTLKVTPDDIGSNKPWASYQEVVASIEGGLTAVPIPTASNNVWLFIDKNTVEETITITNPYLSVEIICGDRTITIVEDFA